MFAGNGNGGFSVFTRDAFFPAQLMNNCREKQGMREAMRFGQLTRQSQSRLDPRQSLIGLTKKPQCPGGMALCSNSGVLRIAESVVAIPLRIEKCEGSPEVFHGGSELPHMHESGFHGEAGVRNMPSQSQEFFGNLVCSLHL